MAALGYIEILDGKGGVSERIAVDGFPVTVGRAYGNQVILTDSFVCPRHLKIAQDEQGRLLASDLDSVNGFYPGSGNERVAQLELQSGSQFRIGHTTLRYVSVDHPPAPTLVDGAAKVLPLASPYAAVISGVVLVLLLCLEAYLSSVERVTVAKIIGDTWVTVSMLATWAGMWALASRIVVSRFNFARHVTIACLALLAISAIGVVAEWSEFFLPRIPMLWIAGVFGYGLVLAGLIYGHLGASSLVRRRSRLWTAAAISLVVVGTSAISDFAARSKFSTIMDYTGVVKPIDAAWVPATSVEEFVASSEKLKKDLDSLTKKAKALQ
ncbi:MAG: FHA domain-containing protein [Candidatus Binatia bacterium]